MMLLHSTAQVPHPEPIPITLNGGALCDVLFNPKYAGNIYEVTVAVDAIGCFWVPMLLCAAVLWGSNWGVKAG